MKQYDDSSSKKSVKFKNKGELPNDFSGMGYLKQGNGRTSPLRDNRTA